MRIKWNTGGTFRIVAGDDDDDGSVRDGCIIIDVLPNARIPVAWYPAATATAANSDSLKPIPPPILQWAKIIADQRLGNTTSDMSSASYAAMRWIDSRDAKNPLRSVALPGVFFPSVELSDEYWHRSYALARILLPENASDKEREAVAIQLPVWHLEYIRDAPRFDTPLPILLSAGGDCEDATALIMQMFRLAVKFGRWKWSRYTPYAVILEQAAEKALHVLAVLLASDDMVICDGTAAVDPLFRSQNSSGSVPPILDTFTGFRNIGQRSISPQFYDGGNITIPLHRFYGNVYLLIGETHALIPPRGTLICDIHPANRRAKLITKEYDDGYRALIAATQDNLAFPMPIADEISRLLAAVAPAAKREPDFHALSEYDFRIHGPIIAFVPSFLYSEASRREARNFILSKLASPLFPASPLVIASLGSAALGAGPRFMSPWQDALRQAERILRTSALPTDPVVPVGKLLELAELAEDAEELAGSAVHKVEERVKATERKIAAHMQRDKQTQQSVRQDLSVLQGAAGK